MREKIISLADRFIIWGYYLLFFLIPLILTPYNYELFEYNKMMLTYSLTVFIGASWVTKMIAKRELKIAQTPLTIPLLVFLASQTISTIISIDTHLSLFGYYSRFNGGLISTISYTLLYFAFVTNFPRDHIRKLIKISFISATLVSFYGVLEHMGIDKHIWVQDVQNRVFSSLGQPNWLAAYLSILIPICSGFLVLPHNFNKSSNSKSSLFSIGYVTFLILSGLFYVTLLYTKSRSGFLGFWIADLLFWGLSFTIYKKKIAFDFIISHAIFILITFLSGAPYQQLNQSTLSELTKPPVSAPVEVAKPIGTTVMDIGITESGKIREIVWKGAKDIFLANPILGTGVETFAYSYYKFRPVEHNMTSEWDFLYNKAHNEYLNFAANSGLLGIISYLAIIGIFTVWIIQWFTSQIGKVGDVKDSLNTVLPLALFSGWISILITNFFGFSVVIVQLYFFLIPAFLYVLTQKRSFMSLIPLTKDIKQTVKSTPTQNLGVGDYALFAVCFLLGLYFILTIGRFWVADVFFASGYHSSRTADYASAYKSLRQAIILNENEPVYYDEISYPAAQLALAFYQDDQATNAAELASQSIKASNQAVSLSPANVNFWKTRTRVFYALYQLDESYLTKAKESLEIASKLSPTDPKIFYNLALIMDKFDKKDEAIKLLEQSAKLKPDYRDAYFALGLFYSRERKTEQAKEAFNYILTRINPDDAEAKTQLSEIK